MMENKIDFLKTAISDAQELIRFIDTKTAIVVTILGAYLVSFFASLDKIIEYSFGYSCWFWFFLTSFFVFLTLCIIVTARIIRPTNNPLDNINFGGATNPTLKFFVTPNDYSKGFLHPFVNSKVFKLKENFETYIEQLRTSTDNDIVNSLTLELFKISFIRNIKNDRFNTLLWFLVVTTISFFAAYLFFSIETHTTIEQLKLLHRHCCGA